MDVNPETYTRQMRRRTRTRTSLVAAAEHLFAARGPDAVSIDEIVAAADVAKGTFYNHFSDKDEIAREIAHAVRVEIENEIGRLNRDVADPAMRIARALAAFVRFACAKPERARVMARLHANATNPNAELNAGVRQDVTRGLAKNRFSAPGRDGAIVFVIGTVHAVVHRAAMGIHGSGIRKLTASTGGLLLRGLGIDAREADAIMNQAVGEIFQEGFRLERTQ